MADSRLTCEKCSHTVNVSQKHTRCGIITFEPHAEGQDPYEPKEWTRCACDHTELQKQQALLDAQEGREDLDD